MLPLANIFIHFPIFDAILVRDPVSLGLRSQTSRLITNTLF